MLILNLIIRKLLSALAGVAQWIECWPVNQRVTGSIPSKDTWKKPRGRVEAREGGGFGWGGVEGWGEKAYNCN